MRRRFLKERALFSYCMIIAVWCTGSLPVFAHSQQYTSNKVAQSRKTIQGLPNGNYLFGEVSYPNKVGGKYVVFRKSGNIITGLSYTTNSGDNYCFRGTVKSSTVTNATFAYWSEPDPPNPVRISFVTGQSLDLSRLYRVNGFDSQVNATELIRECNRAFDNRRRTSN